jgi:hypothetical protein
VALIPGRIGLCSSATRAPRVPKSREHLSTRPASLIRCRPFWIHQPGRTAFGLMQKTDSAPGADLCGESPGQIKELKYQNISPTTHTPIPLPFTITPSTFTLNPITFPLLPLTFTHLPTTIKHTPLPLSTNPPPFLLVLLNPLPLTPLALLVPSPPLPSLTPPLPYLNSTTPLNTISRVHPSPDRLSRPEVSSLETKAVTSH